MNSIHAAEKIGAACMKDELLSITPLESPQSPRIQRIKIEGFQVVVIDDFFENPEAIKAHIQTMGFEKQMGLYPGKHHFSTLSSQPWLDWLNENNRNVGGALENAFDAELIPVSEHYENVGFGMISLKNEELTITHSMPHTDHFCDYSMLVYFFNEDEVNGGTSFYRFLPTGEVTGPIDYYHIDAAPPEDRERGYNKAGKTIWEKVAYVPAKFNRFVLFPGNLFHSAVLYGEPRPKGDLGARITMNCHMALGALEQFV